MAQPVACEVACETHAQDEELSIGAKAVSYCLTSALPGVHAQLDCHDVWPMRATLVCCACCRAAYLPIASCTTAKTVVAKAADITAGV